jgi:hypothetical protein
MRAKLDLKWRPRTDLAKLIDAASTYKRAADDPGSWVSGLKGGVREGPSAALASPILLDGR